MSLPYDRNTIIVCTGVKAGAHDDAVDGVYSIMELEITWMIYSKTSYALLKQYEEERIMFFFHEVEYEPGQLLHTGVLNEGVTVRRSYYQKDLKSEQTS